MQFSGRSAFIRSGMDIILIYHLCPLQNPGERYLMFRISPDTDAVRRILHHMLLTGISEHRSHFIIKKGTI